MKQLKHLELADCSITDWHMIPFEKDRLTYLNLSLNDLSIGGFYEVSKFNQLKYLNVSKNKIHDPYGLRKLSQLTQLTILDISHNFIECKMFEYLKKLELLTDLNISFNKIGPEGAKLMSEKNQLTKLDIESNKIGFEGAKHICEMKQLSNLNIRNNNIGAEGIKLIHGTMNQLNCLLIDNVEVEVNICK